MKGIRDLSYKLIFSAINIKVENNQFDEFEVDSDDENGEINKDVVKEQFDETRIWDKVYGPLSETKINNIQKIKENSKKYEDMAESLFPTIYGHQ